MRAQPRIAQFLHANKTSEHFSNALEKDRSWLLLPPALHTRHNGAVGRNAELSNRGAVPQRQAGQHGCPARLIAPILCRAPSRNRSAAPPAPLRHTAPATFRRRILQPALRRRAARRPAQRSAAQRTWAAPLRERNRRPPLTSTLCSSMAAALPEGAGFPRLPRSHTKAGSARSRRGQAAHRRPAPGRPQP